MELKNFQNSNKDSQTSPPKTITKMQAPNSKTSPSKTLLVVGAICFSVVLASLAYKTTLSESSNNSNQQVEAVTATTTDPNQVVVSAVEQAQIDALAGNNEVSSSSNPFDIQPGDTISAKISKKLFAGYFYANQTDGVTTDSAESVANAVVGQIKQADLPDAAFSNSEVSAFSPTSKDQIKAYGNATAGVILENYRYIADNKAKFDGNITEIAKIYKKIGNSMIKQKVPFEIVPTHVSLSNAFVLLGQGMDMIAVQQSDPVKSLLGLKTVKEVESQQYNMLINMSKYFANNGIIFENNEPGSFWNRYLNAIPDQNNANDATTN